jgi:hypothetical protein
MDRDNNKIDLSEDSLKLVLKSVIMTKIIAVAVIILALTNCTTTSEKTYKFEFSDYTIDDDPIIEEWDCESGLPFKMYTIYGDLSNPDPGWEWVLDWKPESTSIKYYNLKNIVQKTAKFLIVCDDHGRVRRYVPKWLPLRSNVQSVYDKPYGDSIAGHMRAMRYKYGFREVIKNSRNRDIEISDMKDREMADIIKEVQKSIEWAKEMSIMREEERARLFNSLPDHVKWELWADQLWRDIWRDIRGYY